MKLASLLKEGYGIMKFAVDLQNWANEKGVTFKKLSSQKKPGSYGSTISDAMYQVGDKFVLSRYSTTPGAPRLNEFKVWILDAPNTSAKVHAGFPYVSDFSNIKINLDKIVSTQGEEVPTWNRASIEKLLRDLAADKQYRSFNDAEAFETAQSILDDHPGLEDAVKIIYRIQDVTGWLANKI